MNLRWEPDGHTGQAWRCLDGENRIVAVAVHYDRPRGWSAYIGQKRGSLRYVTAEEAMAQVERVLTRRATSDW